MQRPLTSSCYVTGAFQVFHVQANDRRTTVQASWRGDKNRSQIVRIDEAGEKINRLCNNRSWVSWCDGFSCVWTRRVKT